ncbi:MAG: hypothetical protein WAT70_01750 [Rhizobiaceae bacterium]
MGNPLPRLALLLLVLPAGCVAAGDNPGELGPYCGRGDGSVVGVYTLRGVPEVGSQFELRPDGSFRFFLAYGANDQHGAGCWTQNQRTVALFPAGRRTIAPDHTPDTRGFTGIVLIKDGQDLLWHIAGSGHVGRYGK